MLKKYLCKCSGTSILVSVNGVVTRVDFDAAVISSTGLRGCAFSTDNKDLQKAIESHKFFGQEGVDGIWTNDVEEPEEEPVDQAEEPVKKVRKPKTK